MTLLSAGIRNIFVVGLDDFNLAQLKTLPGADQYAFHALYTHEEIKCRNGFPVRELLEGGTERLRTCTERIDAIVGYWDFPVSTILPILRGVVNLPGPTLESVLKCEHKYWSRLEQARVIRHQIPNFCVVDPFALDPLSRLTVDFPFWLKPVKSVLSHLGFKIENESDFHYAIDRIREGIGLFGDPFNEILSFAHLPPEVAEVNGNHCIAEAIISAGWQCTLEGYSYDGQVHVYGTVDSLREGAVGSSFSRYQYPSTLPESVQTRMAKIAERVIQQLGYDMAPFNMEFYWEQQTDHVWLLEINSRISKSHAPLFRMVDGCYHHQVMTDLGLGRKPEMPFREGAHACAAKFMVRWHEDAWVTRAPTWQEIEAIEDEIPDVTILVDVKEGMRLSELRYQDSYSYEVATIFIGASDTGELERTYAGVLERLPLELTSVSNANSAGSVN